MKTNKGKMFMGALALTAALVVGAGGTAHALTNILGGSECQPFFPTETPDGQSLQHTPFGTVNFATVAGQMGYGTSRWVECPVLRDNTGNTSGMTNLTVNTKAWTGTAGVNCTGLSMTRFGSVKISKQKSVTTTTSGVQIPFTNTVNASDNGSGAYEVECLLDTNALITSIEYGEP
jgi:hypothetical protein